MRGAILAAVTLVLTGVARAETTVIDFDTVIDGIMDENVEIRAGATPPTTVRVVSPASFDTNLQVYDGSIVHFEGGDIGHDLETYDLCIVNMSGGEVSNDVRLFDGSTMNLSGGYVQETIDVHGSSKLYFSGGEIFDSLTCHEFGTAHVSGGTIYGDLGTHLRVRDSGTIHVYGYGLAMADQWLTGSLADGSSISIPTEIFDNGQILLHEVPEPSTAVLAGLGLLLATMFIHRRHEMP